MIKYWPSRQSVDLNMTVSKLFAHTYQKFFLELTNKTNKNLPLDIFSKYTKKQLLLEALIELEVLIVDIVELDIDIQELKQLNRQILLHLINSTTSKLLKQLGIQKTNFFINFHLNYNRLFFHEHSLGTNVLLTYLIFGSNSIADHAFPFHNNRTPFYHVKAMFENLIIQIGNITTFNILEKSKSAQETYSLMYNKELLLSGHQSIRKLSNFKNNISCYNLISRYINYPQDIYGGKYRVYLLSSRGIICKYIYLNRAYDYIRLSNYQLNSIIYLEIQDFIVPRFNLFIGLIGKLITYVFIEIIGKNLNASLRRITKKLSVNNHE